MPTLLVFMVRRPSDKTTVPAIAVACAVLAAGLLVAISHYVDDKIFKCRKATQVDDISSMTMRLQHTCLEMPGVRFR